MLHSNPHILVAIRDLVREGYMLSLVQKGWQGPEKYSTGNK